MLRPDPIFKIGVFVRISAAALFFLLILADLVFVPDSSAAGFGLYGLLGLGKTEFHEDTDYIGWGFVFDTAVARDRVFNYRLNFGHERLNIDSTDGKETFYGYVFDNDFGLGIIRNDSMRAWVGPEIRVAIQNAEWGIGVGPVACINLHANEVVTLTVKAGYRWMNYSKLLYSSMDETHGFISVGLVFRLRGDRF